MAEAPQERHRPADVPQPHNQPSRPDGERPADVPQSVRLPRDNSDRSERPVIAPQMRPDPINPDGEQLDRINRAAQDERAEPEVPDLPDEFPGESKKAAAARIAGGYAFDPATLRKRRDFPAATVLNPEPVQPPSLADNPVISPGMPLLNVPVTEIPSPEKRG